MSRDDQGRGWELKYAFYLSEEDFPEVEDAVEHMNEKIENWIGRYRRGQFEKLHEIVDWDGPL